MVSLAKAVAVPVIGERERGLKVTADALRDAATPRTRGLMLNSPCNPTGAVYDRDELAAIFALAAARAMTALQPHTTSNAPTVSQYAALAALTQPELAEPAIAAMVEEFRARRDAAMALLDAAGVEYVRPDGAFYLFVDAAREGGDDPGT